MYVLEKDIRKNSNYINSNYINATTASKENLNNFILVIVKYQNKEETDLCHY